MKIEGFLAEKIKTGNAVLFFGAGMGQAIGLKGTQELSNYLFEMAKKPEDYRPYSDKFDQLVARFDKDPQFQRQWSNGKLCDYFIDSTNYKNLSLLERLLMHQWQSLFTTNYDMSVEYAYEKVRGKNIQRLIPVVDPNEVIIIQDRDNNKLKYFKIHGCVREIDINPTKAQKLVITTKDFSESSFRNKTILQEFVSLAYNVPVIFLGFNIHKNSRLLESVYEVHKYLSDTTQQQFTNFYVVLKSIDDETRFELEDLDINILSGDISEFVDSVDNLYKNETIYSTTISDNLDNTISISYLSDHIQKLVLPKSEYDKNSEQFIAYHDHYFTERKSEFQKLNKQEIFDAWKSQPTDMFVFSNRTIQRSQHNQIFEAIKQKIDSVTKSSSDQKDTTSSIKNNIVLWGERGAGKSVLIRQVCKEIYEKLGSPVLFLRDDSVYVENNDGTEVIVSGWNGKTFDKFLSHFSRTSEGRSCVPVIVADHLPHMLYSIKTLYKHLLNHGKEIVLVMVLNESDYLKERDSSIIDDNSTDKEFAGFTAIKVNHVLDDLEINTLFDSVKNDNLRINEFRPTLIQKAKDPAFGKQDLLFILYMWFDEKFRRLEDIILEEAKKIKDNEEFRKLYLSIAVFQQYNLEPRIDLCAISQNISQKAFSLLKADPLFQSLIKLRKHDYYFESYALTRHANFTRKLLNELLSGTNDQKILEQVTIIENVLKAIRPIDLDFVRLLFNNLYDSRIFGPSDVIKLKEASETKNFFKSDFILNHQFAAYLIRENAKDHFDKVQYYLDIAFDTAPPQSKAAILHSKGHLEFKKYVNTGDLNHYFKAKDFFERVRSSSNIPDEPDYVTEIDMITERINKEKDLQEKTLLKVERTALINEAMFVVSPERQNYILNRQEFAIPFDSLKKEERKEIVDFIRSAKAPHTVIKYYLDSKLTNKNSDGWERINEVVQLYYNDNSPLATIVILSSITKSSFVLTAEQRFDFLRKYFDKIVKDKENNLNISLVAEYQRLLLIDAFVLGKFDFIKGAMDDYKSTYRHSFPSYQKDEYILPGEYYNFSSTNKQTQIDLFIYHSEDFYSYKKAQRYERLVYLEHNRTDNYFHIIMDQYSKFYVRGLRRELQGDAQSRISLDFCIRFGRDGFRAADIRRV